MNSIILRTMYSRFNIHSAAKVKEFVNYGFVKREYTNPAGFPGSGAGRGGGSGGSVRESGGGLGKYGAAQEEGYFYDKQKEQLKQIRKKLKLNPEISRKEEK